MTVGGVGQGTSSHIYLSGGYNGGGSAGNKEIMYVPGGSGYIGNSLLTNKSMYCYNCEESSEVNTKTVSTSCTRKMPTRNCAKKVDGFARITLIRGK